MFQTITGFEVNAASFSGDSFCVRTLWAVSKRPSGWMATLSSASTALYRWSVFCDRMQSNCNGIGHIQWNWSIL